MDKFLRVYSLKVEVDTGLQGASPLPIALQANKQVTIRLPITVEFEISRQNQSSAQTATFRLYNLSEPTRKALQKDIWRYQNRAIQFRAGYRSPAGDFMPLCFNGQVSSANSYRENGSVDFVTEIEAFDGGLAMTLGTVAFSQAAGITSGQTLKKLAASMPYLTGTAIIGSFPAVSKRGEVFLGNTWDLIQQKSDGTAVIDNGQLKALHPWEVMQGEIRVISAETGLLGSPRRGDQTLDLETIFEPALTLNQQIEVRSTTTPQYNRLWKVVGFDHHGRISESGSSGDALTSVRLFFTQTDLLRVEGVPVQ